jgi:glycosyltransferase involved in cell wall biosynthesis
VRIAIVAEPYVKIPPPTYGGIEQIILYLIRGLRDAGHEPILLAPGDSDVDCELIPTTEHALSFPASTKDMRRHAQLVKRVNRRTERLLRELLPDVDIIHSHGFDLKRFNGFPNLTTLHNPIEFRSDSYYLNRRGIDYYEKRKELYYASISKNFQDTFPDLNYAGVVYNGEDPDDFPMVYEPEDYVCFLGRFDRDKSPHLAIQLAISRGIKIKLAGKIDHKNESYFQEEISPYLKHPHVEYLGELGFDDKVELLSNARANLHPTGFREPFGLTVIEAAYCGTPTMAIARGSMPELIENGRTGVLVEDFVEGYHKLDECFKMDRIYVASRARQLFNYRTMTDQYLETYREIISEFPEPQHTENLFRRLLHVTPR